MPHVLIADDNSATRFALRRFIEERFRDCRVSVSECANGHEALVCIDKGPVDLLLLDLEMPVCGGFETLAALASHVAGTMRIVILTEDRRAETVRRAIALGATDFIAKPIRPTVVFDRLSRILTTIEASATEPVPVGVRTIVEGRAAERRDPE